MDDLIVKSLMGETTPEEERTLVSWRSAAPENDARFRVLAATWELSGTAVDPVTSTPPPADTIIRRAERLRAIPGGGKRPPLRKRLSFLTPRRDLPLAGALAAALAAVLLLSEPGIPPAPGAGGAQTILAAEPQTVKLPDGSVVHLASGARFRYQPDEPRNVWLEGRAFFGVSADPDHPFYVHTASGITRVVGTRFDVRTDDGKLTVMVVEGHVQVLTPSGDVEVGTGQQSRSGPDAPPVVEPADPDSVTSWLDNVLIFQATPLSNVARELEQHFGHAVAVPDSELASRTVTAVLSDQTLDDVLPALCRAVDAVCLDVNDTVHFTPRTPTSNR